MNNLKTTVLEFNDLSLNSLYEILRLRSEIFVVEQECAYLDIDGQDQKALHLLMRDSDENLSAYTRILHDDQQKLHIGRVLVRKADRNKGVGKFLMEKTMEVCKERYPEEPIILNAQLYLEQFYKTLGFETQSKPYPWDGILHVDMIYRY